MTELKLPTEARVVIVGGGIMGASLLYHLAEEGWTDCLLIEKGELTSGSTWHAAGQCPSFIADYNMAKIHDYGVNLYPKLEQMTGQYVSWHGCGGIRFALKPAEVEWFERVASVGKLIGFECEIVDPAKIKDLVPYANIDGVLAGAWTLHDGHVDPAGVCNAMAKGARQFGASIVTRNRVLDIKPRVSGDWEVITEQGNVIAEHVVNAAGCYARQVSQMVGTDIPMINMKHTYIVTDTVQTFVETDAEMPVIRDPYPSSYYRQEQKSGLIGIYEMANSEECWTHRDGWPEWDSENELFDPDFDNIMPYIERVMERVPMWGDLGIKRVVCGAIPHTPDSNPFLGPATGLKNFWHCNGASIGIAAGAGSGKYLSQWMIHGDAEINMAGVDPRRFSDFAPGQYTKAKSHEDYEHMYKLHLPGEERAAGRKQRTTPLYDRLFDQGCVFTEANGWERPKWFSLDGREEEIGFRHNNTFEVVAEECRAVRERVGVLDLSSFAKYDVVGTGAETLLNRISANKMPGREGGITLTHYLSPEGRLNGESTITRLAENYYYVLSGANCEERDLAILNQGVEAGEDVSIQNITNDWGVLVVAGPCGRDLLRKVTDADLSNDSFRWLTGKEITVAGVSVRALRVNYVGELGWELHCPMGQMLSLYDSIWQAGEEFGIANFGTYAVNSLRMEKAYKGWGAELTNEITPIEAGVERFFNESKESFIGREGALKVRAEGPKIKIVYLEVEAGDNDIVGGEPLMDGEKVIGITTSGGYGHYTSKSLGFGYVETSYAADGKQFEVELLGQKRSVTVLSEPVWDPASERSRV
ncbi:MAG: FAD-dependent oxidoreductase [Arenicellales bacterium]